MRSSTVSQGRVAFTLVELMVSAAIVGLLGLILVQITGQTSKTWRYTSSKIEQFRESRLAFDTLTTRLSQATLNTYWDYDNPTTPTKYERRSELRFISGRADNNEALLGPRDAAKRLTHCVFFHAPLGFVDDTKTPTPATNYHGLENLLNLWGYYVEYGDDADLRPPTLSTAVPPLPFRTRFRLMEMMVPAERVPIYKYTSGGPANGAPLAESYVKREWFQALANGTPSYSHVLAENVVALILRPQLSPSDRADLKNSGLANAELAPNYFYDTTEKGENRFLNKKNQLPPVVQVTMVAIDEASAQRLRLDANSHNIFEIQGKFQVASKFTEDLNINLDAGPNISLENKLAALKVNYRVFSSTVPIRGAKWSQEQQN